MNIISDWLHDFTHKHIHASKLGMGEFVFCKWRFRREGDIWYRPDFDGAGWHKVPDPGKNFDESKAARMFRAGSSEQAMAILREEAVT